MAQPYKICPICKTPAHWNAAVCSTCGAALSDVEPVSGKPRPQPSRAAYDRYRGETDLFEGELQRKGNIYLIGGLVTVLLLACAGFVFLVAPRFSAGPALTPTQSTTVPTRGGSGAGVPELAVATNTPRPTLDFATVTPAPPTATATPTEGPCMRQVQSGDDLISLAFSCGHRDLSIVDVIVEINDLASPDSLQAGQTIEIPWPTPTADPNSLPADLPTEDVNADTGADNEQAAADNTLAPVEQALANSAAIATETLQPGLTWHRVQPNENIISIAGQYGANVEIMSQLNPEVTFSQCDYGLDTGGPNCIVNIYIGQLLRVPAPTPTPTIPPTASGSETPTPSPTPTRNIPSLTSPSNRTIFAVNELVTLRWVASGALGEDQVYQVRVEDTTAGVVYTAETRELSFIVPDVWQGQDARRHDYTWSVSVLNTDDPDNPLYTTEARTFTWQGRGEST